MSEAKAFSLTQSKKYNEYLERHFHESVVNFSCSSELLKAIIRFKYQSNDLFLVFLDATYIGFPESLALIKRLSGINAPLCYLFYIDVLDEAIISLVREVSEDQALILSGEVSYAEFVQAVFQLYKVSSLSEEVMQIDHRLSQLEKHYHEQQLLFNGLFGLIKYNHHGEIVEVNSMATDLIGRHASQLIGTEIYEIFPSLRKDKGLLKIPVISGEERYINARGFQKWAQITIKEYQESHQIMYALVLQDITAQKDEARSFQFKLFDESLKKARSELTHNLGNTLNSMNATQTVLKRGVKSLFDISDYIQRWLKEKSGEANKVDAVKFIEAINKGLNEALEKKISESNQAMDADLKVVSEILSVDELEATSFTDEEVNIYNLVESLIRSTKAYCDEHDVSVRMLDTNTKLLLHTSRNLLHQALLNLIKNAVESLGESNNSTKLVTIQTLEKGEEGVSIFVRDNGEGIPEENLDKVFQLGFTTKVSGTGQGLHSIANYMNHYRGAVIVSSDQDQGTCFELRFPSELVSWL